MKGADDAIYIMAVLFTFMIGISYSVFLNLNTGQDNFRLRYDTLVHFLGIPDENINKIISSKTLEGSLSYVYAFETEDLMVIVIKNTGDLPLSGFKVLLDNKETALEIAPDILYPQSKGALIIDKSNISSAEKTVSIKTRQNAEIRITL
jgi:hypothetical protein